ncbi:MAG: hypothetical protein ACI4W2_04435 [Eubacterium sp.]
MQKSRKLTAVYALIMDLPLSIVITLIAIGLAHNFTLQMFVMNSIIAYILTFLINMFIPAPKWGSAFAVKHAQPGTFKFGLLLNIIVAGVFVIILDIVMTGIGVLGFQHLGMKVYFISVLGGFIPCYLPTLIIAMLWNGPSDRMSRAICREPAAEILA